MRYIICYFAANFAFLGLVAGLFGPDFGILSFKQCDHPSTFFFFFDEFEYALVRYIKTDNCC